MLTAKEVPSATQALSTVSASPKILIRPYWRVRESAWPEALMIFPSSEITTSSVSDRSLMDCFRSPSPIGTSFSGVAMLAGLELWDSWSVGTGKEEEGC